MLRSTVRLAPGSVVGLVACALSTGALSTCALSSCATPRSVVELPPCADRVELQGQAVRVSETRFELDHTFDLALSRTQLQFLADGRAHEIVIENNQPEPLRLVLGGAAAVVGVVLLGDAASDLALGADPWTEGPFYAAIAGGALLVGGGAAAVTGWHPQRQLLSFPDACDRAPRPEGRPASPDGR